MYVVRGRTRIGRAADSDIQILHDGVSRQHAQVIEDSAGNAVLVDLASNNGTFVAHKRVVRQRLTPGDEIRILRDRFLFEEVPDHEELGASSAAFAVKVHSTEAHKRTVDHWMLDLPAPRTRDDGGSVVVEPGPERHRVVACYADGSTYPGDILGDILEFRALRLRSSRGDALPEAEIQRYQELQTALQQPADETKRVARHRKFCRFRCGFPARLRHGEHFGDRTARATVADISAGGAGVGVPGITLGVGELAWLVIDLVVGARPRTIVLTGRVVRAESDRYGVLFAGAPEWEQWRPAHP